MKLARRALPAALLALVSLPLLAAGPWDAPPFSADPKALLDAAKTVDAGGRNAVILLDEATYSVEPDGRMRMRLHVIYRVATEKGVEMFDSTVASWEPWYDERPEMRARVIAPDGSVHALDPKAVTEASAEFDRNIFSDDRVLHAPLPGVTAGAIVETLTETLGKNVLPGAGRSGFFQFGGVLVEEQARLVIEGPAGFAPHVVNNAGIEPRVVEADGRKQFIFERTHIAGDDTDEAYLASDDTIHPYVAFSTGTSWGELARQYAEIVDKQIAAGDVRDVAAAARRGATKREEIVDRLLAYVESNVHYAGVEVGDGSIVPRVPTGVLKNKYGDCKDKATLLVALLRAAGVPAHVALLDAGFEFDVLKELPAMGRFNHAIVVAGSGESAIWIDPTDEFARAGALPVEDQGRMALVAAPETTSLTRTPELPSSATRISETRTFTLPEEGKARIVETTTATAAEEASMRRFRAEMEPDKYKESMEKYAKSYYAARAFDKMTVSDPRDLTTPFTLTLELSDSKAGVVTNGDGNVGMSLQGIFTVPEILRDYEEPGPNDTAPPAKKRKHDFVFPRPSVNEWTYRVVLPPGYKARTLPPNETKRLGTATLTSEYAAGPDGVVVAKFRFDTGKRRLTAAEFQETRVAVSKAAKEMQLNLGFDSIGQARLTAGDVRGALDEFRRLAALHPKEAQHHIEIARALLIGGLGEAARDEARRAVAIEPNSAAAHFTLGAVLEYDLVGRPFHSGCDLPGAVAEVRKSTQLDPTELTHRIELAEILIVGDDGFRFGRNNHLAEGIDEYKAILKDFGTEGKAYEPRLMLFYAHAGRWAEMKALLDTMADSERKNEWRIFLAAATNGVAAATHELDAFGGDQRRRYAQAVAQTLTALARYPEAAALMEIVAQGSTNAAQMQQALNALKKAHRGATSDDTPAGAVTALLRAYVEQDDATIKKLAPPEASDGSKIGFSPKSIPMENMTPDVLADFITALAQVQTEGNDATGYRVRVRLFGGGVRSSVTAFVQGEPKKYTVAALDEAGLGDAVLKLADAGKLDAARTWLNWAREDISGGGDDDPLARYPFAVLWPKDKATATAEEIRLAAATLMEKQETAAPILLAAREKATDEQKTWIDVALTTVYDDPARIAAVAEPLMKSHPDSMRAFMTWATAMGRAGKVAEAEAAAKQRLERSPRNREALEMLSLLAARRLDYTAAAAYSRRILDELTPSENDYNNAAWIVLFTGKDIEKGIEDAQRASSATSRGVSASLHTLAALYAESGKNLEARQALMQSIEKRFSDTPSPSDWYVVGRIAENYGVPEAAKAAYKRVEKKDVDGLSTWELSQRRLAAMK